MKELKAMQVAMDQFNEVIDSVVTTKARTTDPWTSHAAFRRMSELKRQGLIEDSGEVHTGRSGRKAIKYKLTELGINYVR